MTVRRTLPHRTRTLIGAWCFADHYGPNDVAATRGMDVPPHPHTGLQTVSRLFSGEVEHTDSLGTPFQHHVPEPLRIDGAEIRVFLGSLAGDTSPVRTFTPLLGAEIVLATARDDHPSPGR
ncbi:hypothetical protein AQI70_20665 [Streptomyces curacoi]|uniref:Pirin N-terminal domain-containing protein n=1 Tax=Streptomyces curacoi TaxID=146536 RepID=A0A117P549_9ACTN|nr:hypothetical protein AQI70_20665 [Streptomyces curacoi]